MAGEATRLRAPFAVVVLVELVPEAADVVVTCDAVVDADVWPGELLQPVSPRLASTTAGMNALRHRRVIFTDDYVARAIRRRGNGEWQWPSPRSRSPRPQLPRPCR